MVCPLPEVFRIEKTVCMAKNTSLFNSRQKNSRFRPRCQLFYEKTSSLWAFSVFVKKNSSLAAAYLLSLANFSMNWVKAWTPSSPMAL